jgi:serine/threonine-protein kinase 24/25/MST4
MEGLRKLERIGKGTFGEVFKAVDGEEQKVVAVKVIDGLTQDIDEIHREIRLLGRCQHHPNIVKYRRTVVDRNRLWIVMDYCELGSVRQLVESLGPVPEKAAVFIGKEVLQALAFLHDSSIVHGDIKSANVLLTGDGQVKLGDFGVSHGLGTTNEVRLAGSPYWMAPEVIKQSRFDAKADIWSFGVTMFELLTGNPPLWRLDPSRAMKTIVKSMPPRLEASAVGREVKEVVNACLHDDPDRRPSARDLLKAKVFRNARQSALADLIKQYLASIEHHLDTQYQ